MRLLKIFLIAILAFAALTAGLFVTMAVAAVAAVIFFVRHLLGRPAAPRISPPPTERRRVPHGPASDVIDVTATEVPSDPTQR